MFSQLSALTRAGAGQRLPPASPPEHAAGSNPALKKSSCPPSSQRQSSLTPDSVPIHHLTHLEFDTDQSQHRSCSSTPLTAELETLCQPQEQDRYPFGSFPKRSGSTNTACTSRSASSSYSLSPSSLSSAAAAHPDHPSSRIPVRTRHSSLSESHHPKRASHSVSTPQLRQPSSQPKPDRRPQKDQPRAAPPARRLAQKPSKSAPSPPSQPRKRQATLPGDLRRLPSLTHTAFFSRSPRLEDQLELHQQLVQNAQAARTTEQRSRERDTNKVPPFRPPVAQGTRASLPSRPAMHQSQPMRKAPTDVPGGLCPAPRLGHSPSRLRAVSTTDVSRAVASPSPAHPSKPVGSHSLPRQPSSSARERLLPPNSLCLPPIPPRSSSPNLDALQLSLIPIRRESRAELVGALECLVGHDRLQMLTNVELLIKGVAPEAQELGQAGSPPAPSKPATGTKKSAGLFGRWGWRSRRASAVDGALKCSFAEPARQPVFGCPLDASEPFSCVTVIGGQKHLIPIVVFATVEEIYARGMSTLGLMRTAGETARLESLVEIFEQLPSYGDGFDVSYESVHVLCGLLKRYLRALPAPLMAPGLFELLWACCVRPEGEGVASDERRIAAAQCLLRLMPRRHFSLLVYLTAFLAQVARFPENKLAPAALMRIFGPALLGARPLARSFSASRPSEPAHADTRPAEALAWLLDHWSALTVGLLKEHFVPRVPPRSLPRPPSHSVAEPPPSTRPPVGLGIATKTSQQAPAAAVARSASHSQGDGQQPRAPVRAGHSERVAAALASFAGTETSALPLLSVRAQGFRRHSVSSAQSIVDRYEAKSVLAVDQINDEVEQTTTVVTTMIKRKGANTGEHAALDGNASSRVQTLQDARRSMTSKLDSLHTSSKPSVIVEEPTIETPTTTSSPTSQGPTKEAPSQGGEGEEGRKMKEEQSKLETAKMLSQSIEVIEAHERMLKKMKSELTELIEKL